MTTTAVITVVHERHDHFVRQQDGFSTCQPPPDQRCVVAMDDPVIPTLAAPGVHVVECRSHSAALPLACARNQGAAEAIRRGAELLIFLDVDCIPGPTLIDRYLDAHRRVEGDALLCGPVTYLPPAADGYPAGDLDAMTDPHPARPAPPAGVLQAESNHDLFWSLSFAVSVTTWRHLGGFCEEYAGYGGEDTDLGAVAAARRIPLYWVGGAHAYHQHHPVSDPPVEHLDAIVANARVFHRRWGRWPMTGWLNAFEHDGLITRDGDRIAVVNAATRSVDA